MFASGLTNKNISTCLKWPLFLCRGAGRPWTPRPTTSAWRSAWPGPPSSSAAPTCRPWCGCCRSADSWPPPAPGPSESRRPAACRRRPACGSHGRSSSGCRCPARSGENNAGECKCGDPTEVVHWSLMNAAKVSSEAKENDWTDLPLNNQIITVNVAC